MRTSFIVNDTLYLANVSYILLGFSNLYMSGLALHALILNPHALHLVPRLINIVRGVVPNPSLDPSLYLTTFFTKTLKNLGIHILPRISLCVFAHYQGTYVLNRAIQDTNRSKLQEQLEFSMLDGNYAKSKLDFEETA